jgi:hypothetical protein
VTASFYKVYLHALNTGKDPIRKDRRAWSPYVTPRLIGVIDKMIASPDDLDADYFIQAQDFDKSWEENVKVSPTQITASKVTLTVRLGKGREANAPLNLTLRKDAAGWKIDGVQMGR